MRGTLSAQPRVAKARAATWTLPFLASWPLLLGACGMSADRTGEREAVVLVSIDTLRADRLGVGGDPKAHTPFLDRTARRGTQWVRALSPVPLTLPGHATMHTGRTPPEHGARDNGSYRVDDGIPLVAETLQEHGWRTAAFLAAFPLAARFGLARGFDVYHDAPGLRVEGSASSFAERTAPEVNEDVFAWLDGETDRAPLFLWVHYFDPHAPYSPPRPWMRATRSDAYRAEISFTDHGLGQLLRRLDHDFSRVHLTVTADHGESLGEHDEETHGIFVYESTTRVPLLLEGPGIQAGALDPSVVSLTRIAGTLLERAGVPDDEDAFPEPSLLAAEPAIQEAYVESAYPRLRHGWSDLRGFRTDRWKVIRAPRPEVYDLVADPGESRNLHDSAELPTDPADLLARLEDDALELIPPASTPDPEVEEALRSLGYAGSTPSEAIDALADPKDRVHVERALGRAGGMVESGRLALARDAIMRVLALDPGNKEARMLRARVEGMSGYTEWALELLDECLALPPASMNSLVHYEAGKIHLDAGDPAEAGIRFAAAVELDRLNVDALYNWGVSAYRVGDFGDAADRWRRVLELDPGHPLATQWLPDAEQRARGETP